MINTFLAWTEANRHRFRLSPRITGTDVTAVKVEILPGLTVSARTRNQTFAINVYVMNPRDHLGIWDILREFEACPKERDGKWFCQWCEDFPKPEAGSLRFYASRDELLIQHAFEPFLNWINTELAVADGVGLYRIGRDVIWGKLVNGDSDQEIQHRVHWIPVQRSV